ncbi:MAG: TIGR02147 family protein [Fibrobacterales bacterium]
MKEIYDYLDYREYIKDFYEFQKAKKSWFSYRYISQKVGIDAGFLVKVLQGKNNITEKHLPQMITLLKLDEKEKEYFETLVHFTKAKTQKQISIFFNKLIDLKNLSATIIEQKKFEFYSKWHHNAIRSLIDFYDFKGDFDALGNKLSPPISAEEAKKSIVLLESLNLISKDETGRYQLTDTIITTGQSWQSIAISEFQQQMITLSQESLVRHPKKDRDVSTLTFSVPTDELDELRERITEFRSTTLKWIQEQNNEDAVYQLNLQLFPLTTLEQTGGES